jgi:hypothetical protein
MRNYPPKPKPPASEQATQPRVEYLLPDPASMMQVGHGSLAAPPQELPKSREAIASAGLAQFFGLDPRIAVIAIVLDTMLFFGEIATGGILIVFSLLAGIVFGFITYKAQKRWYGDDHESSLIKGSIMGLLTAIPTHLPAFLYVPAGFVGLVHLFRRK